MEEIKEHSDLILSQIGLERQMISRAPNYQIYNEALFTRYTSSEYLGSQRKETDEAYRMFEITLLHKQSGLRIGYAATESYDGETVDYKMINIFIRTLSGTTQDVVSVDFKRRLVFTEAESILFNAIDTTSCQ